MTAPEPAIAPRPFRGPYADGPPASALEVRTPELDHVRGKEIWRFVVVATVVLFHLTRSAGVAAVRRRPVDAAAADGLIDAFVALGPTYVKLGQIIASSGGIVPAVLGERARRCLDAVPPFPTEAVHRVIEEDLGQVDEVFASFDDEPLSAASIGQVHACTLDDGRRAVVKIQRPDIAAKMATDLRIGYRLATWLERTRWGVGSGARGIIEDLHKVTFEELNPTLEAWRQHQFRELIHSFGDNELVTAPAVYWDHCGPRVICMEFVEGLPMDDFDELERRGIDGQAMLRRGAKVWTESVMIHGPFHGDMHAGNVWVLDDGRGCFLDFGIMGELPDEWKQVLKDLFYSCMFDRDFVRIARAFRSVGALPAEAGTDEELGRGLEMLLGPLLDDGFGNLDIAVLVTQALELVNNFDAEMPRELVLISKQLLYIDRYTKQLAPTYSLTSDPYVVRNIFPDEARAKAAELGIDLDAIR